MLKQKLAETFQEVFSNVAKSLNISQIPNLIFKTSQTDPVLKSIEKLSKHPSIINITPCAYDLENEKRIKLLEKNIDEPFGWFSENFLKGNPDKCHLLIVHKY